MKAVWKGPYSWPHYEAKNGLLPIPKQPGVYLLTVEYRDGYLIYAAGITRRTIPERMREHTRKYMRGEYNILDIDAMQQGVRREIWHGWGWSPAKRMEYDERRALLVEAACRQLEGFRIFVTYIGTEPRILERLEAAIMNHLYQQPVPVNDIPDKGMMLAPRWSSETPITVTSLCVSKIHSLPACIDI